MHHRRSIRLKGHDYTAAGTYFVTVCVRDRECLLGQITDGTMSLNNYGHIVANAWQWLSTRYGVILDESVVMPNHLHGIIGRDGRGGSRTAPTLDRKPNEDRDKPLGGLIGAFKTVSTKRINLSRQTPGMKVWQRDYWDRVVRDAMELDRIRDYIRGNVANWSADPLNPDTAPAKEFGFRGS